MTLAPEGRKLLRLEVRNAAVPIEKKPDWIKTRLKTGPEYQNLQNLVKTEGLHTVCQEAGCPNIYECWEDREATFLIGGDQCTRRCDFCLIDTGKPGELDRDEPRRVAESIRTMNLRYATITGVTRDDLPDEGAWLYAETVRQVHALAPDTGVEILTPDFSGHAELLGQVFDAAPEVFAHNLETVPRIFRRIRPAFTYERSLDVIAQGRGGRHGHQVQPDPGHGRDARGDLPGVGGHALRRVRPGHHHPVPAPDSPAPSGGAMGQARGVRRARQRGRADRFRRRDVRTAGPVVLPRRDPVPAGRTGQGRAPDIVRDGISATAFATTGLPTPAAPTSALSATG